jgi:POT family proton-dependent oligopeptide transporter
MEKISSSHSQAAIIYSISKIFDRAGYYGARAILVLYMMDDLGMEVSEALAIYGTFTASVYILKGIGGLLGDFVIGNKITGIIGGALFVIGILGLAYGPLNLSLVVMAIGSGLMEPNTVALFGQEYLRKTKLLDGASSIFYLFINLGAFIGILVIGILSEKYGYHTGFIISAVFAMVSLVLFILAGKPIPFENQPKLKSDNSSRWVAIGIAGLVSIIFWTMFDLGGASVYEIQFSFDYFQNANKYDLFSYTNLSSIGTMIFAIIAAIIWSLYYLKTFLKLAIGLFAGAASFALLLAIPEQAGNAHLSLFFLSILLICFAEIMIAPIIMSAYIKNSGPKRIALVYGLMAVAVSIIMKTMNQFTYKLDIYDSFNTLFMTAGVLLLTGIGILIFSQNFNPQKVFDESDEIDSQEFEDME